MGLMVGWNYVNFFCNDRIDPNIPSARVSHSSLSSDWTRTAWMLKTSNKAQIRKLDWQYKKWVPCFEVKKKKERKNSDIDSLAIAKLRLHRISLTKRKKKELGCTTRTEKSGFTKRERWGRGGTEKGKSGQMGSTYKNESNAWYHQLMEYLRIQRKKNSSSWRKSKITAHFIQRIHFQFG